MKLKNIEVFFLNTLLKISIVSTALILLVDVLLFVEDALSLWIDTTILISLIMGYWLRNRFPMVSIYLVTVVALAAMIYQCIQVPLNTTTSLTIILIDGFVFSVMLKGRAMWIMHIITLGAIIAVFITQAILPAYRFTSSVSELGTIAFTYAVLYILLTYSTYILKSGYDKLYDSLHEAHRESSERAKEIAAQNEELIQMQDNLNSLNTNLEGIVRERTLRIQMQNEVMMKYSYANAHHLRGPVARLLGLANISELRDSLSPQFIIDRMREQAIEIDEVVRKINVELESINSQFPSGSGRI